MQGSQNLCLVLGVSEASAFCTLRSTHAHSQQSCYSHAGVCRVTTLPGPRGPAEVRVGSKSPSDTEGPGVLVWLAGMSPVRSHDNPAMLI